MGPINKTLDAKVVLVTGGGRGIGKAVAIASAQGGAKVAITGRSEGELLTTSNSIQRTGGTCLHIPGDVTSASAVERVVSDVTSRFGPIDVLVNNAGVVGEFAPPWLSDADVWWQTLEVNLRGPMLCSRAVLPAMVARGSGRIINIGSYIGVRATPDNIAYATSKAALARYTDSLAAAVADHGVKVFTVSPGLVRTAMAEQLPGVDDFPAEAWTAAEDVAAFIVRLARGDADGLTGRFLHAATDDLDDVITKEAAIVAQGWYQLRLLKADGPVE